MCISLYLNIHDGHYLSYKFTAANTGIYITLTECFHILTCCDGSSYALSETVKIRKIVRIKMFMLILCNNGDFESHDIRPVEDRGRK
jgi:hypothetical protein